MNSSLLTDYTEITVKAEKAPSNWQLVKDVLRLFVPNVLGILFALVPYTINIVIAGNLGDPNLLAAVGIGSTTVNMMLVSLLLGLNSAQETLTP